VFETFRIGLQQPLRYPNSGRDPDSRGLPDPFGVQRAYQRAAEDLPIEDPLQAASIRTDEADTLLEDQNLADGYVDLSEGTREECERSLALPLWGQRQLWPLGWTGPKGRTSEGRSDVRLVPTEHPRRGFRLGPCYSVHVPSVLVLTNSLSGD
jgi:hypothetical protein